MGGGALSMSARMCASVVFAISLMILGVPVSAVHAEPFVAGTTPDRRPESAPRVTQLLRNDAWLEQATIGITKPHPPLSFLSDQGAWFTPFNVPGMPKPYDIRGLHAARDGASARVSGDTSVLSVPPKKP